MRCAPRSNGTPKLRVSVMQRPPTRSVASSRMKRRPAAAMRRAAAIPAAPAPTIITSASPEGATAPSAGDATAAAEPARNDRRDNDRKDSGFMVCEWLPRRGVPQPKLCPNRPAIANFMANIALPRLRAGQPNCNQSRLNLEAMKRLADLTHALSGNAIMDWMLGGIGHKLARYLERPVDGYEPFTPSDPEALRLTLQPGDVLL